MSTEQKPMTMTINVRPTEVKEAVHTSLLNRGYSPVKIEATPDGGFQAEIEVIPKAPAKPPRKRRQKAAAPPAPAPEPEKGKARG